MPQQYNDLRPWLGDEMKRYKIELGNFISNKYLTNNPLNVGHRSLVLSVWVTSVSLDPSGSIRWAGEAAADGQSCFVTIICCLLAAWLLAGGGGGAAWRRLGSISMV